MPEESSKYIRIVPVSEMEKAADLDPLWGNWIFRRSVVLQAGETGIAKTTFNYGLAKAIVDNEEFLGVRPTSPDLVALMLDWESSDSLIKSRMRGIGYPKNAKNFLVYNDPNYILKDIDRAIEEAGSGLKFDILFIDPIRMAFMMKDEIDNAEATREGRYYRQLAVKYDCAVIAVAHSGKAELSGTRKASGAFARASLADVCMNFDSLGEDFDRNIFKLSIPKNRLIDDEFMVFVKKDAKQFTVCDPPPGYGISTEYEASTGQYSTQQWVEMILNPHVAKSPHQVSAELGDSVSKVTIHKALNNLMALGKVERTEYGGYKKNSFRPYNT